MPKLSITKEQIEDSKPWDEGWYPAVQKEAKAAISADKQSVNVTVFFTVTNKSTGKEKVIPTNVMNNKNKEMFLKKMVPYAEAMLGKPITEDFELDTDEFNGTACSVYIEHNEWGGIVSNRVTQFAPAGNLGEVGPRMEITL